MEPRFAEAMPYIAVHTVFALRTAEVGIITAEMDMRIKATDTWHRQIERSGTFMNDSGHVWSAACTCQPHTGETRVEIELKGCHQALRGC